MQFSPAWKEKKKKKAFPLLKWQPSITLCFHKMSVDNEHEEDRKKVFLDRAELIWVKLLPLLHLQAAPVALIHFPCIFS